MPEVYLVVTTPDYEGFSIIEAHLDRAAAEARMNAANAYARSAPKFPRDDEGDAAYEAFMAAEKVWRAGHPFGERSCGYLQESYTVFAIPLM